MRVVEPMIGIMEQISAKTKPKIILNTAPIPHENIALGPANFAVKKGVNNQPEPKIELMDASNRPVGLMTRFIKTLFKNERKYTTGFGG